MTNLFQWLTTNTPHGSLHTLKVPWWLVIVAMVLAMAIIGAVRGK